jgi:hypothetical protein
MCINTCESDRLITFLDARDAQGLDFPRPARFPM